MQKDSKNYSRMEEVLFEEKFKNWSSWLGEKPQPLTKKNPKHSRTVKSRRTGKKLFIKFSESKN